MESRLYESVFSLGTYLFEFWLVRYYFQAFYASRAATRRYQYAMIVAVSVFLTLLNGSMTDVTALMPISQNIMFFVFVRACYIGNIRRLIFEVVIVFSTSIAAELIGSFVILTLFPNPYGLFRPFDMLYITATILGKLVWYMLIRIIMASRKDRKSDHIRQSNTFLSFIPIVTSCLLIVIVLAAKEQSDRSLNSILGLLLSVLIVVACVVVFRLYESYLERNEMAYRLKQVQDETEYYSTIVQNEAILRSRRHEYINSLATIRGMLATNADPTEYIRQILADFGTPQELAATADFNNKVVNAVLNNNKTICKEYGIGLEIDIEYYELSFLKPLDTGTLLNNAFNNAVEACKQVPDTDRRRIWLKIYRVHDELVIGMKNTKANKIITANGAVLSSKDDADGPVHGHGLSNMRRAAEKYGGSIHIAGEGAEFILTIRLKLPGDSGKETRAL